VASVKKRPAVPAARRTKTFGNWPEERPRPARWLYDEQIREVAISRVPDEIKDHLNDPAAGENLAVLDRLLQRLRQEQRIKAEQFTIRHS
jgi:hypothetical protein